MSIPFGFAVPMEPGFYAEVDGSKSGVQGYIKSKVLVLGQRLSTGTVAKDTLVFVPSVAAGKLYFGRGSQIAREIEILKLAYPLAEVWAIAQDDDPAAVVATGTLTVTVAGTAASGTISQYIGGQLVSVPVTAGESQNEIAAKIKNYIIDATYNPNMADLPVTAAAPANIVTVTAKNKGLLGNKIDLRVNYRESWGGEVLPTNVDIDIVSMSAGTTEPSLTNTIAAMLDNEYDTIVDPYILSSTSLDAAKAEMASRWLPLRMVYGHVCSAYHDTFANLVTWGGTAAKNDPHMTALAFYDSPTPPWEVAAALAALTAEYQMDSGEATLALGFTGLKIYGMKPPKGGSEFSITERNTLLSYGLATFTTSGGDCYLSRARTTYRTDSSGSPDAAFYDQRTLAILQRIIRSDKQAFLRDFSGAMLVEDASRVGGGQRVCSPAIARGWFAGRYMDYEKSGLVTDVDTFLDGLIIEINGDNPNQLDVLYPPQLSGWLAVAAVKVQFGL